MGHVSWQAPLAQTFPFPQMLPQAPQLLGSLSVRVQVLLQRLPPLAHSHLAFKHFEEASQVSPQAPQFPPSALRSTHWPLQFWKPEGHTHAPPEQVFPPPQVRPQAPQLSGSLRRSTQLSPQAENGAWHWETQALAWQKGAPLPQMLPHLPQLLGSLVSGRQVPLHSSLPIGHKQLPCEQL